MHAVRPCRPLELVGVAVSVLVTSCAPQHTARDCRCYWHCCQHCDRRLYSCHARSAPLHTARACWCGLVDVSGHAYRERPPKRHVATIDRTISHSPRILIQAYSYKAQAHHTATILLTWQHERQQERQQLRETTRKARMLRVSSQGNITGGTTREKQEKRECYKFPHKATEQERQQEKGKRTCRKQVAATRCPVARAAARTMSAGSMVCSAVREGTLRGSAWGAP